MYSKHGKCRNCGGDAQYRITTNDRDGSPPRRYVKGRDDNPSYTFACERHVESELEAIKTSGFRGQVQPFRACIECNGTGTGPLREKIVGKSKYLICTCPSCGSSGDSYFQEYE